MESKPKVAVLLATYRPFPFVTEQIASILNQEDVEITIFWGDDGSSFEEIEKVENCLSGATYFKYLYNRIGSNENFLNLLKAANGFNYYAFCDQDDIWNARKLITQVRILESCKEPILGVHSHPVLLREKERVQTEIKCLTESLKLLIFSNCCQGCSLMLNSAARSSVLNSLPAQINWYDWWISLVIVHRGKLLKSDEPLFDYRQHSDNQIGNRHIFLKSWRIFIGRKGLRTTQLLDFIKSESPNMNKELRQDLIEIHSSLEGGLIRRLRLFSKMPRLRQTIFEDLLFKLRCVLFRP